MTVWPVLVVLAGLEVPSGAMTTGVAVVGRGETSRATGVVHGRLDARVDVQRFFVEARASVLLSGEQTASFEDLGSSITVGVRLSDVVRRVSLEFIPFNSVNRRAFFDWDNRVGTLPSRAMVPALTATLELERVRLWVTGRLLVRQDTGAVGAAALPPVDPDLLAGMDVTLLDGLSAGVRGAWLPSARLLAPIIDPQFIVSARVEYTWRHAVAPTPDFVNYGNDPQRFERFFTALDASGPAAQASLEGGFAGARVSRAAMVELVAAGWLDAQARLQFGDVRLSVTGRVQTADLLLFENSARSPSVNVTKEPRLLGLVGASWTWRPARLTPAVLLGVSRPAVLRLAPADPGGSNPPPGLGGARTVTGDREGTVTLTAETEVRARFSVGTSLTWQPADAIALLGTFEVLTQQRQACRNPTGSGVECGPDDAPLVRAQVLAQFRF